MKKVALLALVSASLLLPVFAKAEITHPYTVDYKPQVLFGDSIKIEIPNADHTATTTYLGLENYKQDYVNGYAHFTFTYTHNSYGTDCCYASYPPNVYVTDSDPRLTSTPVQKSLASAYTLQIHWGIFGNSLDWYSYDIQFDATGYRVIVKEAGETEVFNSHTDVTGQSSNDWVAIANLYPIDAAPSPNVYSMAFEPVPITNVPQTAACCSNVLFLPGLEASRLYKQKNLLGLLEEDQLWEPNLPSDVSDLFLDQNGNSINSNIYTKDIIGESNVLPFPKTIVYKSFIQELNKLVATTSLNKINDWKPYAYDWRHGISDLIKNGTNYDNNQKISLIETLQSLVNTSKTGKVTIIAHSNGGLLAKALIKKLQDDNNDLINHIDNVVLVASPQLGTPSSITSILHGYDQNIGWGWLLDGIRARELAQNMPSAYGLLPSKKYFEQVGVSSLAVFDPTSAQIYRTAYGSDINNYKEEHNFVLGQEGRVQPSESDLISPIKGNATLLTEAESLHDSIDNMVIPSSIKVIEIAGWGKETIAGITYTDSDIQPIYTIKGDKTVVIPSALYGQGIKYWLDLSQSKLEHSDILEDSQLLSFIGDLIQQKPPGTSSLKDAEPIQLGNRLHLSVHSPITIGVTDNNGNFTGKVCDENNNCFIQENIPGSTYQEFGDGKYVTLAEGNLKDVTMQGTDLGTFTFDFEKVTPSGTSQMQSFIDIPVTTQTQAELTVNPTTGTPQLSLDVTGDGKADFTLVPNSTFDPIMYLHIMETTIDSLDLTQTKKNAFDKRVDNIIKSIQKGKIDKAKLKADRFKNVLENKLAKPDPKKPRPKQLSKTDAQLILDMLNQLLDNLN